MVESASVVPHSGASLFPVFLFVFQGWMKSWLSNFTPGVSEA